MKKSLSIFFVLVFLMFVLGACSDSNVVDDNMDVDNQQRVFDDEKENVQSEIINICDMADVEKIKRFMGIYQTSSPSYILMASMDACMDKLRKDGQQMFREFTFNLEKARQRLSKCEKIKLIEGSMIEGSGIYDFDRSKLLFGPVPLKWVPPLPEKALAPMRVTLSAI